MYLSYFDKFHNMEPYLEIDEKEWEYIKTTFEKQDVRESLAKVAMTYPPPYMDISKKDAYRDLQKLKGMKHTDILVDGEWFAREGTEYRYDLTYEGKQQYFRRLNAGNDSSNYFQQANRWSVDGTIAPGPIRTWESHKFMTTLIGSAYSLKLPKIDKGSFRTMIGLRKYICSQFKPNVSKVLYDKLRSENVLDFSAGWGDRLAGFYCGDTTKHYVGIDPNTNNHPSYKKQVEFYKKHQTFFEEDKEVDLICEPAEDVDYSEYENHFDTIFTSPPYFNVEKYSDEDTQSYIRYQDIDSWNKNFLHKALGKMIPTLKEGGILAINIADVYNPKSKNKEYYQICNPMNDFLQSKGLKYKGCIGMEMTKRFNSGGAGNAKSEYFDEHLKEKTKETQDIAFGEPIWIWEK